MNGPTRWDPDAGFVWGPEEPLHAFQTGEILAAESPKESAPAMEVVEAAGQAGEERTTSDVETVIPKPATDKTAIPADTRDVVTVVRDPANLLGKRFTIGQDGRVHKAAAVTLNTGVAVMRYVPDAVTLASLLREVAEDEHAAIIPDRFLNLDVGEPFYILSQDSLAAKLDVPVEDRERLVGVHTLKIGGKRVKAVARLKENFAPSAWRLLDRDVDEHTPSHLAALDSNAWLATVDELLPSVASAERVRTGSTSSRVQRNGEVVGAGNGHVWVHVSDADDCDRTRTAILVRAVEHGLAWRKPRLSRETGQPIGIGSLTTIIDPAVWVPGRLVFVGRPVAGPGLDVRPPTIEAVSGNLLDTAMATLPDAEEVRRITRDAGCELALRAKGNSIAVDVYDLTADTAIETEHGTVVLSELLKDMSPGSKVRCQSPFRASESFAAFVRVNDEGEPCVHDVGTGETHWFDEASRTTLNLPARPGAAAPASDFDVIPMGPTKASRFPVLTMADMLARERPTWIVKDFLPQAAIAVVYGESGSGKTFVVLDMGMAVARGIDWRGKRTKPGRVVYIAGEGGGGFRNRLEAYCLRNRMSPEDAGVEVIVAAPNFLVKDDISEVAASIGAADLVIVDTLAQVTPGANENAAEDMGRALAHCKAIHTLTGALVVLVHHTGKDLTKGARGWSGLRAAADAEIEVSRDGNVRALRVTKQKDGEDGLRWLFGLEVVELGLDADGDPITSCVVVESASGVAADRDLLLRILRETIDAGVTVSPSSFSRKSAFNCMKVHPDFPKAVNSSNVAQEVSRWLAEGLVMVEEFTRPNRTQGERLIVTRAGLALLDSGGSK